MSAPNVERRINQRDDDSPEKPEEQHNLLQELIEGGVRKSLGLSREDVHVGLDLAKSQLQKGQHAEAFKTYATMILLDPIDPELQIGFANCALVVGENSLALQAASAAIVQMPEDCRGYLLSGKACLALGLKDECKEDFIKAMELSDGKNMIVTKAAKKYLAMIEKME